MPASTVPAAVPAVQLDVPCVLLVDADEQVGLTIASLIEPRWQVLRAPSVLVAQQLLASRSFALVVLEAAVGSSAELFEGAAARPALMLLCQCAPDALSARAADAILLKPHTSGVALQSTLLALLGSGQIPG
ncbi:MAG: hypothetical protein V4508_12740 [Pseudomonadota bacterium]